MDKLALALGALLLCAAAGVTLWRLREEDKRLMPVQAAHTLYRATLPPGPLAPAAMVSACKTLVWAKTPGAQFPAREPAPQPLPRGLIWTHGFVQRGQQFTITCIYRETGALSISLLPVLSQFAPGRPDLPEGLSYFEGAEIVSIGTNPTAVRSSHAQLPSDQIHRR